MIYLKFRKSKFAVLFLILNCILFSCNNGIEDISDISLQSPPQKSVVNFLNIAFDWQSNNDGPFKFSISSDSNFTQIIFDTLLYQNEITISHLSPTTVFYWKVEVDFVTDSSSFSTNNPLTDIHRYNGVATVREYLEDTSTGIYFDTLYKEDIEFDYSANTAIIKSELGSFTSECEFETYLDQESPVIIYLLGSGSNFTLMDYYINNDSIALQRKAGAIGGGRRWSASIKR